MLPISPRHGDFEDVRESGIAFKRFILGRNLAKKSVLSRIPEYCPTDPSLGGKVKVAGCVATFLCQMSL